MTLDPLDPTAEDVTRLEKFAAPYGREIILEDVVHGSGMRMLRLRIREGRRFTVLDLDPETANYWGAALSDWAKKAAS